MKHRISPATIIASVALFFSLGGVGVAATHYRITSIFQIAPKVRHALRGQRGPVGPQGPQGIAGTPGPQGPVGAAADVDNPRLGVLMGCAVNISYAGFGNAPEPIVLSWTDNGTVIKTQTVQTSLVGEDNNSINLISVTPPAVPAGDTLGLGASWTYDGGGQIGSVTTVSYC